MKLLYYTAIRSMMGLCTEGKPASVLVPSPDISSIKEYKILVISA